ncbi:MAG: helix-turn-helix transcriptional regulator [Defluviitaleaceae bacterium]|nr:helix-turn-helix transcriptional regulator [Defluviitaleaceae bacterium]
MKNGAKLLLGEKIKYIRSAKGISQENMARAINSNQSFVYRFENGQVECSTKMLTKIKKFLEIENAPLLEHELETYRDRIWIWNDLITAGRDAEAKVMQHELSPILDLPFENDLFLLFSLAEVRLLTRELKITEAEKRLNELEALLVDANDEVRYFYHRNKGSMHIQRGDFMNALRHYLQMLDTASDEVKPDAAVFANIGVSYMGIGKPYHAIENLLHARQKCSDDRVHIVRASTNSMLAMAYAVIGEYKKAQKLFDESLLQAKNANDEAVIGLTLSNMSVLYYKMGNYEKSVELCDQALEYFQGKSPHLKTSAITIGGDKTLHKMLLLNKGSGLIKMKDDTKCQEVLEHGLALSEGDEKYTIGFTALRHFMTLDDSNSVSYLENVAIPYFRAGGGFDKYVTLDICGELESYYKKKRARTRASVFVEIARDIYKEMFIGEIEL